VRPLKITMTAFGPYKHREMIDFTELKDNRLFVVSGNTGAGKTTIFDAICFALYGSASGEDRSDSKLMRSDFADDDIHTSVELEFELHNHYYRIKRQLPHVKKGNKSATGEQYEFYENVDGREVPCVDRQIVSDINKKVEGLVGLTKDQFSQIVMLPQGEFRKLLTSQTENKEEILRKIFKTEPYKWISERLKEKKKSAEVDFNREEQTRDRYIKDIRAIIPDREESKLFETLSQEHFNTNQIITGLDEETAFYQNEIVKNRKIEAEVDTAFNLKLKKLHLAELLNKEFEKLEEKEGELREKTELVLQYKEKEKQLENADRAGRIEAYEKQVNEWRKDEREKKEKLEESDDEQKDTAKQLEKAQNIYEIETKKKADREEIVRELDRYNGFLPTVKEIHSKKEELLKDDREVQKLEKDLEALKKKIEAEKDSKVQLGQDIREIEKDVDQLPEMQQKLSEMRDQVRILKDYLGFNEKQAELEENFNTKEAAYQILLKQYVELENAWVNGQASILAVHLHDGKPCPVCGSSEHPNKAEGQDSVPTKDELEAVKKELNLVESDYRDIAARLKTNREQLEIKAVEVAKMGILVEDSQYSFNQLVKDGQDMKKNVESLQKEKIRLAKLKEDLGNKEKTLDQFDVKQQGLAQAFQEKSKAFEAKKAVFEVQINQIPAEIRTLTDLEQKIKDTEAIKARLEKAWDAAQSQLQQARDAETKATTNLANAIKQLEESRFKKEKSEKEFSEALLNASFTTESAYRQAKMTEMDRQKLKQDIDNFNSSLEALKKQVIDLQKALRGKTKADLAALKFEHDELKQAFEDAKECLRKSEQYQQKITESREKILEAEQSVVELEKQLNIITDLYDVVRGHNSSRISFERYLQIEFLEQIIQSANERLKQLSNGQFLLERSERQESRGKQSGLGLDVFDAFTGQTRDVKTLSGGEKFNASLCLALGMADVIQSFQGGVSIDTMFIDEGFGSLDEESLNKAIDTLIDLQQSGRMIGVISHVQELKNVFPAILEVKKTKEGYSQTQFIVK
jgi:DNA repair protein SbcC/Rad50